MTTPAYDLMPAQLKASIPDLYAQEGLGHQAIVHVKYFLPDASWTWYATEFDGHDCFFGYVANDSHPQGGEFGNFSLSELQSLRGNLGLYVERDLHWEPTPLGQVLQEVQQKLKARSS